MLLLDVVDIGCRVSLFFSLYNMVTLGLRDFECQSFKEFLKWKEKEEEDNNTFYAQSTGKKPFTDINKILFKYQLYPEIDIEGEDFNRPDHFELLHNLGCHYDSIISEINTRSVIEAHIDCTH